MAEGLIIASEEQIKAAQAKAGEFGGNLSLALEALYGPRYVLPTSPLLDFMAAPEFVTPPQPSESSN